MRWSIGGQLVQRSATSAWEERTLNWKFCSAVMKLSNGSGQLRKGWPRFVRDESGTSGKQSLQRLAFTHLHAAEPMKLFSRALEHGSCLISHLLVLQAIREPRAPIALRRPPERGELALFLCLDRFTA